MQYLSFVLPNGLRIIHLFSISPVSYCGFAVNAGMRDEKPDQHGLAHFVEHNLFKGTKKRKAWHILNRMEGVGGELNAYTTKEETCYYTVCLSEDIERAIELLSDMVFHSQFPDIEIEKEREVVFDEINSYMDTPSELIFDEFENLIFEGNELGHNILGDQESLSGFTSATCRSFTENFYRPDNMVFFSYGNVPSKKIVRLVNKYMAAEKDILVKSSENKPFVMERTMPFINPAKPLTVNKNLHQTHVVIGGRTCSIFDKRRIGLSLLNNILGGPGMNSRLNVSLREKRGLVYTVESGLNLYTDSGIFTVYFGCDHVSTEKCLDLVYKEFKRLRENKLSGSQLAAAVKQWKGQLGISSDQHENLALGVGKRFLRFNEYENLPQVYRKIDALTADELWNSANDFFEENQLFALIYK